MLEKNTYTFGSFFSSLIREKVTIFFQPYFSCLK